MKAVPVLAATIQLSQAAADGCQSATSLERRHAAQVRADCPPVRLLEFLCSEAGTAVDRAAEQVRGSGSGVGLGSQRRRGVRGYGAAIAVRPLRTLLTRAVPPASIIHAAG